MLESGLLTGNVLGMLDLGDRSFFALFKALVERQPAYRCGVSKMAQAMHVEASRVVSNDRKVQSDDGGPVVHGWARTCSRGRLPIAEPRQGTRR